MWISPFGYETKCCISSAWGRGLRFREVMLSTHSSESYYGCVPLMRASCTLSFGMLRCCSTIISGQCFGKEQPRQQGYAGMAVVVKWMAASAWNGPLFHSWVIAMDLYVIITLSYTLWLSCCAARWGLQRDEAASTDLDHRLKKNKTKQRKIQAVKCISNFWMSWEKETPFALEGLESQFSSSRIIVKS